MVDITLTRRNALNTEVIHLPSGNHIAFALIPGTKNMTASGKVSNDDLKHIENVYRNQIADGDFQIQRSE